MNKLDRWKKQYNFNCQLYNGDYNIYVEKNDIEVFYTGGHYLFKEALYEVLEWLERVNKKNKI